VARNPAVRICSRDFLDPVQSIREAKINIIISPLKFSSTGFVEPYGGQNERQLIVDGAKEQLVFHPEYTFGAVV
jgi:hypothetical protein